MPRSANPLSIHILTKHPKLGIMQNKQTTQTPPPCPSGDLITATQDHGGVSNRHTDSG